MPVSRWAYWGALSVSKYWCTSRQFKEEVCPNVSFTRTYNLLEVSSIYLHWCRQRVLAMNINYSTWDGVKWNLVLTFVPVGDGARWGQCQGLCPPQQLGPRQEGRAQTTIGLPAVLGVRHLFPGLPTAGERHFWEGIHGFTQPPSFSVLRH